MRLEFATLPPADAYRWLASTVTPRPIAWVSTCASTYSSIDLARINHNLAPFSFFQVVCDHPPTLMISISQRNDGGLKDTLLNLRDTGELVIQLVSAAQSEAMNASSASLQRGSSEFERFGIAAVASERIAPLRVAGAAVAFECEVAEIIPFPAASPRNHVVFATVLLAHIDDAVLSDARHVDAAKLDLIGRLGGSAYTHTREVFHMDRPG